MLLEARPMGWFTEKVELRLNGTLVGQVRPKWFKEGLDLELLQKNVRFEKASWLKSEFVLKDEAGIELGSAAAQGFFGQRWRLNLSSGTAEMSRAGWFTSEYIVQQGDLIAARVGLIEWFSRAWRVVADDTLTAVDVLLIGLTYAVIRHRENRKNST